MARNQNGKRPQREMPDGHAEGSPPKTKMSPKSRTRSSVGSNPKPYGRRAMVSDPDANQTSAIGKNPEETSDCSNVMSQGNSEPDADCTTQDASGPTQKSEKQFRLMDLPAELRLNIFRCCLTRPYNILLHLDPPPPAPQPINSNEDDGADSQADDTTLAGARRIAGSSGRHSQPITARDRAQLRHASNASNARRTRAHVRRRITTRSITQSRSALSESSGSNAYYSPKQTRLPKPQDQDPLIPAILCVSKQVHKEARSVLYADNLFELDLESARPSLGRLHQRSRGQIRHIELTIPNLGDILENFAEVVRLGLRYCWGLHRLVIHMPFSLPSDGSGPHGNSTVYANAFGILRWLPRQTEVVFEGNVSDEIRSVAGKCAKLAKTLDEVQYARRQLISDEADRLAVAEK